MTRSVPGVAVLRARLLGLSRGIQSKLIYLPYPAVVPPVARVLPGAREVTLQTTDGLALGAWYVPAGAGSSGDEGGGAGGVTVLVASGNAGNRFMRAPLAQALAAAGLSVLLFDYRGYGGNPGRPSEEGLARDVRAAYRFLVEQAKVSPGRLLYFGESLGTAVVTELAAEHPPAGLVLRSPFVDLAAVGRIHYPFLPVDRLLADRYALVSHLAQVTAPTMVVYGGVDAIVPPAQSRAVAKAAPGLVRAIEVPGADHNDMALLDGPELVGAVVELADRIRRGP